MPQPSAFTPNIADLSHSARSSARSALPSSLLARLMLLSGVLLVLLANAALLQVGFHPHAAVTVGLSRLQLSLAILAPVTVAAVAMGLTLTRSVLVGLSCGATLVCGLFAASAFRYTFQTLQWHWSDLGPSLVLVQLAGVTLFLARQALTGGLCTWESSVLGRFGLSGFLRALGSFYTGLFTLVGSGLRKERHQAQLATARQALEALEVNTGAGGEEAVQSTLIQSLEHLYGDEAIVLPANAILKVSGQTGGQPLLSEFDHIAITPKAIVVLETKHWAGRISPCADDASQVNLQFADGTSTRRHSPLAQVARKPALLRRALQRVQPAWRDLPVVSAVVLSHPNCTVDAALGQHMILLDDLPNWLHCTLGMTGGADEEGASGNLEASFQPASVAQALKASLDYSLSAQREHRCNLRHEGTEAYRQAYQAYKLAEPQSQAQAQAASEPVTTPGAAAVTPARGVRSFTARQIQRRMRLMRWQAAVGMAMGVYMAVTVALAHGLAAPHGDASVVAQSTATATNNASTGQANAGPHATPSKSCARKFS